MPPTSQKLRGTSTFSYESMGTKWEITIWDSSCQGQSLTDIQNEIIKASQEFDETYSRFKANSLVSKIAKNLGTYEVPQDFLNMLKIYWDLYESSEKKLNPLIGFAISDLGYDANYSLKEKENIRKVPDLFETVSLEDAHQGKIATKEALLFDFGALGKGYFVDKIANLLKRKGYKHFLVNGSGDIYYWNNGFDKLTASEPASFGLEDPEDATKVIGKLEISPSNTLRAFCASGTNRRYWKGKSKNLNHEINAVTLEPADYIVATWVQAESTALADALATCLFFCPPENFFTLSLSNGLNSKFEYLLLNKHRQIKKSDNFKVELY